MQLQMNGDDVMGAVPGDAMMSFPSPAGGGFIF